MEEKRSVMRWKAPLQVRYKTDTLKQERICTGRDISMKGTGLTLEEELQRGCILNLRIDITDIFFYAEGKIAWQKEVLGGSKKLHLTGISFIKLKDAAKNKIFDYLFRFQKEQLRSHWWQGL